MRDHVMSVDASLRTIVRRRVVVVAAAAAAIATACACARRGGGGKAMRAAWTLHAHSWLPSVAHSWDGLLFLRGINVWLKWPSVGDDAGVSGLPVRLVGMRITTSSV